MASQWKYDYNSLQNTLKILIPKPDHWRLWFKRSRAKHLPVEWALQVVLMLVVPQNAPELKEGKSLCVGSRWRAHPLHGIGLGSKPGGHRLPRLAPTGYYMKHWCCLGLGQVSRHTQGHGRCLVMFHLLQAYALQLPAPNHCCKQSRIPKKCQVQLHMSTLSGHLQTGFWGPDVYPPPRLRGPRQPRPVSCVSDSSSKGKLLVLCQGSLFQSRSSLFFWHIIYKDYPWHLPFI